MTPNPLKPTATMWVMKDPDAETGMRQILVTDMADQHLWSWIKYFRRKFREAKKYTGSDEHLDVWIKASIITAPAIYAEAAKRGVLPSPLPGTVEVAQIEAPVLVSKKTTAQRMVEFANRKPKTHPKVVEPGAPGVRHINLDED